MIFLSLVVDDMVKFIKDHATFNVEEDGETEEKKR